MEQLKMFAFFRVHPFIGIVIVSVVAVFALGLFFYSAPTVYGIPFGGQVTLYTPICVLDSACGPQGCTTCAISCNMGCGTFPLICAGLSELVVGGQAYCPIQGYPFLGGGIPKVGGYVLGFGTPKIPVNSIMPPTGVSL